MLASKVIGAASKSKRRLGKPRSGASRRFYLEIPRFAPIFHTVWAGFKPVRTGNLKTAGGDAGAPRQNRP
ncbi:hypothetical protein AGMMS49545_05410 [Betaproteobacteria bacterium]|nr:hypothetical protein AGMMS49545_05410 [Betaproteobacteria bacterium]GHU42947.1 hypothetical protein AGMMS50289_08510 [Betaproteobacteria bacterium]